MRHSQHNAAHRALIVGGLVAASYMEGWESPWSFFGVNLLGFGLMSLRPGLLALIPAFVYSQSLGYDSMSSWLDWSDKFGDMGIGLLVTPLLGIAMYERGHSHEPWFRRPMQRPGVSGLAALCVLAVAIALGDRQSQGPHLHQYFWPFLVLCALQAFRPLPTAAGYARRDPLGMQRHWFLTLLVAISVSAYLLYASFGEWATWRYYAQLHAFPVALIALIVFRAFPREAIFIPFIPTIGRDEWNAETPAEDNETLD